MTSYVLLLSSDDEFNRQLIAESYCVETEDQEDVEWVLPDDVNAPLAKMAACWYPEQDLLSQFPNIECLHSLAAGVDHFGASLLNSTQPMCRIVDKEQKKGMFEYVLWGVIHFQRDFDKAIQNQSQRHWRRYPQQKAKNVRVGIMGLGEIGFYVAKCLAALGYTVSGWSRSLKSAEGVQCFSGDDECQAFLGQSDILINLLPLTQATQKIINQSLIKLLPANAAIINCGRGGHVNNDELIDALTSNQLRGAILDVFDGEPLPIDSLLWTTPNLLITPHMASASSTSVIVAQVNENVLRLNRGEAPINCVSHTESR